MKKALIMQGGWEGHEPVLVSNRFANILRGEGFEVEISDTIECLADRDKLMELDLFVPCFTMSADPMPRECMNNIMEAVGAGVGMAGCHGGMCDSFRWDCQWQFMTGGQWISHPGGDGMEYTVHVHPGSSPIMEGINDFQVKTEHYYLHIDPAIEILASTRFPLVPYYHISNKPIDMPVVWTKYWGNGRVFYTALGHHDDVFDVPEAQLIMTRGMLWAAEGKEYVKKNNLTTDRFIKSDAKMF